MDPKSAPFGVHHCWPFGLWPPCAGTRRPPSTWAESWPWSRPVNQSVSSVLLSLLFKLKFGLTCPGQDGLDHLLMDREGGQQRRRVCCVAMKEGDGEEQQLKKDMMTLFSPIVLHVSPDHLDE